MILTTLFICPQKPITVGPKLDTIEWNYLTQFTTLIAFKSVGNVDANVIVKIIFQPNEFD